MRGLEDLVAFGAGTWIQAGMTGDPIRTLNTWDWDLGRRQAHRIAYRWTDL